MTTCTGCGIKFARKADGGLFPPLHDVTITHKEHRPWKDRNTGILRVGKEQAVYFHVNISCVQRGNSISRATFDGAQLDIHPIVKQRLNKEHKVFLFQQLNISLKMNNTVKRSMPETLLTSKRVETQQAEHVVKI